MSRLQTFLTYEDYETFTLQYHCGNPAISKIGVNAKIVRGICVQHNNCPTCIFYRSVPFKAEALLTEKET